VFGQAGALVLASGDRGEELLPLAEVPLTHGGAVAFQVENVLAAAAAAWAVGLPREAVRAGLRSFRGDVEDAPGRFNVVRLGGATVIVDYAHNPSALAALIAALAAFPARARTLVTSGCNRRDADVTEMGELAGHGFDRVVLYRDWGNRDRGDGELNALFRQGLERGRRVRHVDEADTEADAVARVLAEARPGELVVLGVDGIDAVLRQVRERLAVSG
jgi:cyanophycin synthetase